MGDDAVGLAVEQDRPAGCGIEHHHADRRGLDQGLQVGPGPTLVPVGACVGDSCRCLGGQQHQHLLVLAGELPFAVLVGQKEAADMYSAVTHRRSHGGLGQKRVRGVALRADVAVQIRQVQRSLRVPEAFAQPPVVPFQDLAVLVGSEAGRDEVLELPRAADGCDHTVTGAGQGAGAVHHLRQDHVEIEACADAQAGCAQFGDTVAQDLDFLLEWVGAGQCPVLRDAGAGLQTVTQQVASGARLPPGGPITLIGSCDGDILA